MEIQLSELIEQIKKDGVESAEAEKAAIIAAAEAEAEKIISSAEAKADRVLKKAKEENDRMVRSAEDAIRQAGRNLLISFRESVTRELSAVIGEKVSAAYSREVLSEIIAKAVGAYAKDSEAEGLTVLLGGDDLSALEGTLRAALKDHLQHGVTLKPDDGFSGGFRIATGDGGAYYDYSAEAVSNMLSAYLSPRVASLMKEAGKE